MVTANPTNARVGNRVRKAIDESGIPKGEVVARTGIAQVTLDRKLRGRTSFTVDELVLLSDCLDVDPAIFITGIRNDQPIGATA